MAPRLSIIPGRFVEDDRPDLNHYKVLNALGRHTNDEGWCRVKQGGLGRDVGISRETVCRKLKDLTDWGYVEKHDEDGSGRAIWYRVVLDGPARPVTPASQVNATPPPTCEEQITPGVTRSDHTRCDALHVTPGVTAGVTHNDSFQRPFLTTPSHSPPDETSEDREREGDLLEDLRAEGVALPVVDIVLAPLLGTLRFGGGLDPPALLRSLRDCLAEFSEPVLAEVRDTIRRERAVWPTANVASKIAAAAQPRHLVTIRPGTPGWDAWVDYWRATGKAFLARNYEGRGSARVPTEFPPTPLPRSVPSTSSRRSAP